jgi:two-component system sensor histidine kinase UhpB
MSTTFAKSAAGASIRQARSTLHVAGKLIAAVAGSSNRLVRIAAHPIGASLCLALGYMVLCSAYITLSGRVAASAAWSIEELHNLELLKGLAFVLVTGAAYFWFASHLLKRIAAQQQHLALIFQGVSDCLFLIQVEADDRYRFLCVNTSFLKVTGLTREQVNGKRIDEILPETSLALAKGKYQEAIRGRKTVSWEESVSYPAGRRVGEVTVTPLADKTGTIDQLAGVVRDITERALAGQRSEAYGRKLQVLSRRVVEVQETERRHLARELHDELGQTLTVVQLNLQAVLQSPDAGALAPCLQESLEAVARALEQVHDISLNLRPSILDDLGLEPALRWYTNRQAALAGLQAGFAMDPLEQRLDPIIETECFRIAQEALTNVVRHAQARTVTVELHTKEGRLHLSVRDDGVGFDVAPVREQAVRGVSLGLLSMEERAALAGGGLEFKSTPGQGAEVQAWFPLKWQTPPSESETA